MKTIVPLHRYFDAHTIIALNDEVEDIVKLRFVLIEEGHKGPKPAFIHKYVRLSGTFINQVDFHP